MGSQLSPFDPRRYGNIRQGTYILGPTLIAHSSTIERRLVVTSNCSFAALKASAARLMSSRLSGLPMTNSPDGVGGLVVTDTVSVVQPPALKALDISAANRKVSLSSPVYCMQTLVPGAPKRAIVEAIADS